jgi:hypothetical protein
VHATTRPENHTALILHRARQALVQSVVHREAQLLLLLLGLQESSHLDPLLPGIGWLVPLLAVVLEEQAIIARWLEV